MGRMEREKESKAEVAEQRRAKLTNINENNNARFTQLPHTFTRHPMFEDFLVSLVHNP